MPTSEATRADAIRCGIPLTTLDDIDRLDLTVDGADEIDPALNVIKGGGGALLREKIVAAASDRMIVIADDSKWVEVLGRFPLPVEVIPVRPGGDAARHGRGVCGKRRFRAQWSVRKGKDGHVFVTDGGHWIVDAHLGRIPDAPRLAGSLSCDTGRCRARAVCRSCQHGDAGQPCQGIRVVERR